MVSRKIRLPYATYALRTARAFDPMPSLVPRVRSRDGCNTSIENLCDTRLKRADYAKYMCGPFNPVRCRTWQLLKSKLITITSPTRR